MARLLFALMMLESVCLGHFEQRDEVSYLRGPYNIEFFRRHNYSFRTSAAIHFSHGKQHDVLLLTPIARSEHFDSKFDSECVWYLFHPPRTEPTMELFGPYSARIVWDLYRAIDWTHMHHEQTYDIMSDRNIPWDRKKEWTDRSVEYYVTKLDIPRSVAPLDITMRRAGVMMKPYATFFRNKYPQSNNFFYAAHWWHPVVYEAQMIAGNDEEQEAALHTIDMLMRQVVLKDRPLRMLLSREAMPRYSRMSPESANIFDNLHMLHGIAYDILAYPDWTLEQKRDEMYRVIRAMSYQEGDERYVRKFTLPQPDFEPRIYSDWVKGFEGDMNRIMFEMMDEMMPLMMDPNDMSGDMKKQMHEQLRMKLTPGMQEGEHEGSIHDAMMKVMPKMKMMPESMQPGATPMKMINAMLDGWRNKYGNLPDVEPISMATEPSLPPIAQEGGPR